jgi:DNA-binding transcriptional regulator YiaG
MNRQRRHTGTGGTATAKGLTAGYLLRKIREQTGHTQEALAEYLGVDLNTYRGWETGRRSLGQVKASTLNGIIRKLLLLGGDPRDLDRIHTAIDVDTFIGDVLRGHATPGDHPLANWVSTRDWNDLLGWALVGPEDNGLIPRPRLPATDRRRFFDNLRTVADRAAEDDTLLRRQVYFLAARDDSPAARDWLAAAERREQRRIRRADSWTPAWVTGRSIAVARACQGDPEPLRDFIDHHLADELCEAANLRYWAYWVGESTTQAVSDNFMTADLGRWRGTTLLAHLADGLHSRTPYLDLTVHTVWALLEQRPWLLGDDHRLTERVARRVRNLLDDPPAHLGARARRELDQLHFATRMHTAKGPR